MKQQNIYTRPTLKLFYKLLLFVFVIGNFYNSDGQIVTRIVGGGSSFTSGLPATDNRLGHPGGITVDRYGNLYIVEMMNNDVVKVDTNGIMTSFAGTGGAGFSGDSGQATAALLSFPANVGCDTFGNVYIADNANHRIRKVDVSTGIITTVCGDGRPRDLGNNGLAATASTYAPTDVKFDKYNNMYISSAIAGSIRKVDASGIIRKIAGTDSNGNSGNEGSATNAKIYPSFLFITGSNEIYFSCVGMALIRKIDNSGIIHHIGGVQNCGFYDSDEVPATGACIDVEQFVVTEDGTIFLTDHINNRLRKIDRAGIIHTYLGDGTRLTYGDGGTIDSAKTCRPQSMAFDNCSNILFSDTDNPTIRKITFDHCNYLSTPTVKNISQTPAFYPNPFSSELTIENKTPIESLVVFNLLGQKIFEDNNLPQQKAIDTRIWPNGMYLLQINHGTIQKVLKGE